MSVYFKQILLYHSFPMYFKTLLHFFGLNKLNNFPILSIVNKYQLRQLIRNPAERMV